MSRVDRLTENALVTEINAAVRDLEALRTNPQGFGSDSVKTHRVFTASAYDIQVNSVGFNNKVVEVTFTPDDTREGLGGVIDFDYVMTVSSGDFSDALLEPLLPVTDPDDADYGKSKWRIYLSASDSFPAAYVRLKCYVFANGSGTITTALV